LSAASRLLPVVLSRGLKVASVHFYLFSKFDIQSIRKTDGKGSVLKVTYFFDSPASFRKLEIEPNRQH